MVQSGQFTQEGLAPVSIEVVAETVVGQTEGVVEVEAQGQAPTATTTEAVPVGTPTNTSPTDTVGLGDVGPPEVLL